MENTQNSWIISDTVVAGTSTTTRKTKNTSKRATSHRRKRQKTMGTMKKSMVGEKKSTRGRRKTKHLTGASYFVMAAIAVFIIATGLLFQQLIITQLNSEVRNMQVSLTDIQSTNDSKSGQLVRTDELDTIEATARSYGMTDIASNQYVYETTMDTQRASVDQGENQSWIRSIFQ